MPRTVSVDAALNAELERIFTGARASLELTVRAALTRGLNPARYRTPDQRPGDATAAYRARQLARANAILEDLRRQVAGKPRRAIFVAYRATVSAVDETIGPGLNLDGGFGTTHLRAIEVLARNMESALDAAVTNAGDNVAAVFERADRLERALQAGDAPTGAVPFVGRRVDDPYRREGLRAVAESIASLDTSPQTARRLVRHLVTSGATDAATGFVDRLGRRWPLDRYATMVARTTTREAMTRATRNRLAEGGLSIVTISTHPHVSDECDPYDGRTFAMTAGADARRGLGDGAAAIVGDPLLGDIQAAPSPGGLPVLDRYPPFHPQCAHVLTAGAGNLDAFEASLYDSLERLHEEAGARAEGFSSAEERAAYEKWAQQETNRAKRQRQGYHAGWRCFNCKRFVTGPGATCAACGQRHGGVYHEAYATR
jgi:hypothetical protein